MMNTLFIVLFFLLFVFEGVGLFSVNSFLPFFYILLASLLSLFVLLRRERIKFPKAASLLYSLFLLFSLVSALFFSVDKQSSFETWLVYAAFFLFFIFFYNHKLNEDLFFFLLSFAGMVFSLIYLLTVLFPLYVNLLPQTAYQFLYQYVASHNHLGDYLGLLIIGYFYYFYQSKKAVYLLFSIALFILLFVFSSRSAYMSVLISLYFLISVYAKSNERKITKIIYFILLGLMIFIFTATSQQGRRLIDEKLFRKNSSSLYYDQKDLFANRTEYLRQASLAFFKRPFFGAGLNNFIHESKLLRKEYSAASSTTHNIFLDILVETGAFSFIFFTLLIFLLFKKSSKRSLMFYTSVYLLANFQSDYTFKISGFLALLFISLSQIYKEEDEWKSSSLLPVFSILLLTIVSLIFLSSIFIYKGLYKASVIVYPLNIYSYKSIIEENIAQDKIKAKKYMTKLEWIAGGNTQVLTYLGSVNETFGNHKDARDYYQKAYDANPLISFDVIKKIYYYKKLFESNKEADLYLERALRYYKEHISEWLFKRQIRKEVVKFCRKEKLMICTTLGW